jgi:hypothetical protein
MGNTGEESQRWAKAGYQYLITVYGLIVTQEATFAK